MKNKSYKKRGLSSIIGTLMMVAVVAVIGSVILFQGLNGINDFNYYLSFLTGSNNASFENAVIEHVRFNPTDNNLDVWVRNTGTVQIDIIKFTVVRMDTQEVLVNDTPNTIISINQIENINHPDDAAFDWQDAGYVDAEYRISLTTSEGNSYETTATPFNS
jgi:flagellin-like protein